MDLEARSLPPTQKATLLAKLREYKSDLNNLKRDVKKSSSASDPAASRDELLEAGMGDHVTVRSHLQTVKLIYVFCVLTFLIYACTRLWKLVSPETLLETRI